MSKEGDQVNVRDLPDVERPSFRLRHFGAEILSSAELIQVLTGVSDFEAAERVLAESGGLSFIRKMAVEEFEKINGIGEASAIKLIAASELGARMTTERADVRQRIFGADDVFKMFEIGYLGEKQEIIKSLLLNAKYGVVGVETISKGGIVSVFVEPRDVFRPAVKRGATGVIMVHNHPSGDPTPSKDDLVATARIEKAGDMIGIKLIDHIIIGQGRFTSLRDMNVLGIEDHTRSIVADPEERERGR